MKKQTRSTAKSPLVRLVGWHAGPDAPETDPTTPGHGHRLAHGMASAAAIATAGLIGPAALSAPGDLDPSFADVGRKSDLDLDGPLWSLNVQDNNAILFGGGDEYCYYSCDLTDFNGRLLPDGTVDAGFSAAPLDKAIVYDTALQSDGKLVGVGTVRRPDGAFKAQVFRLLPNGSLDAGFGLGGLVLVADGTSITESGRSVVVEPDGRIVIAGARGATLLVVRLLANGALDPAFGTNGVFVSSTTSQRASVVRASGGGYRVMASLQGWKCSVTGLTETGALDPGFGNAGVAVPATATKDSVGCNSLATDATGRLLVGGSSLTADNGSDGHVARLLANGTPDPGLSTAPISTQFREVTALTVGPTGSIFVAGRDRGDFSGATVVRMLPDGSLDPLYGRAGASRIELKAPLPTHPVINDMQALGNDALVVGGSRHVTNNWYGAAPFVARLLGNAATGGPGVLSMRKDSVVGTEQSGQAIVSVRRIGGTRGAIAVSYTARDIARPSQAASPMASKGQDYTAIAGRLTWADGDDSDRQVVVPIASDTQAEPPEFFELALENPEGGAGLGVYGTTIEIAGGGYPAGLLSIQPSTVTAWENGTAVFNVNRDAYSAGVVSVTVRVAGGTATPGQDFASPGQRNAWSDVVLTFQDNERFKQVEVPILNDGNKEAAETITLELVSPTGGAELGAQTQATVTIADVQLVSSSGTGGGGGAFGWFATLLLGLGGGLRRLLPRDGRHRRGA